MGKVKKGGPTPAFSKGASSSNPERVSSKKSQGNGGTQRSKATINRLNLYRSSSVKRNVKGEVVGGDLADRDKAGGKDITGATGRIQPDRRWFGNTRTIGQNELDKFREEMRTVSANPYAVVLKRKKVPMGLVSTAQDGNDDDGGAASSKARRADLLGVESFEETFSKGRPKKRPKLPAAIVAALSGNNNNNNHTSAASEEEGTGALATFAASAAARSAAYSEKWADSAGGADERCLASEQRDVWSTRDEVRTDILKKGQSRRIWSELYKVLDCSDVVLHVLDARDPEGTMCDRVVKQLKERQTHKHLVFVLNKCDLVPNSVLKRWLKVLGATAPTLAFRASVSKAYGKGALINVLRQYAVLHKESQQISVGVVGFPNVGKSSIINALKAKAVCKAAPIPGETKIWQYVSLTRRINLIDSPGVVYQDPKTAHVTPGETADVATVLRGIARAEKLPDPEAYCAPILRRAENHHIARHYDLDFDPPDDAAAFDAYCENYLRSLAHKAGRLLPGGEPDVRHVAINMINAWVRGSIPHFVPPEGWQAANDDAKAARMDGNKKGDAQLAAAPTSDDDDEEEEEAGDEDEVEAEDDEAEDEEQPDENDGDDDDDDDAPAEEDEAPAAASDADEDEDEPPAQPEPALAKPDPTPPARRKKRKKHKY